MFLPGSIVLVANFFRWGRIYCVYRRGYKGVYLAVMRVCVVVFMTFFLTKVAGR